jgi:hypothetical protein
MIELAKMYPFTTDIIVFSVLAVILTVVMYRIGYHRGKKMAMEVFVQGISLSTREEESSD